LTIRVMAPNSQSVSVYVSGGEKCRSGCGQKNAALVPILTASTENL